MKAAELADYTRDAVVGTAVERYQLPCFDPPPAEDARKILADAEDELAAEDAGAGYGKRMYLEGMVKWARWLVEMAAEQATGLSIDYETQAIRIGDFALVGLPGEVFVEYALCIASRSPFHQTAVMAYTNGSPGYIPTAAAHEHGGYEVDGAYRFYGGGYTMIRPESEGLILGAADRGLRGLLEECR